MLVILLFVWVVSGASVSNHASTNGIPLFPQGNNLSTFFTATALTVTYLDSITKKLAYKFVAADTVSIDSISIRFTVTGSPVANIKLSIQTDNSDAPSGTILGDSTDAFAAPTALGNTGMKALKTRTGSLVKNTPYWVVIEPSAVTTLNSTNYLQLTRMPVACFEKIRTYNGADWTTVTAQTYSCHLIFKLRTGTVTGYQFAAQARTASNNIYDTLRQGIKFRVGAKVEISKVFFVIHKQTTPNSLILKCYKNSTLLSTDSLAAGLVTAAANHSIVLTTPFIANPDTNYYAIFSQTGTSDAAYYDIFVATCDSNLASAVMSDSTAFVFGSGNDPTALTVTRGQIPLMCPLFNNIQYSLTTAACGSSLSSLDSIYAQRIYQSKYLKHTFSKVDGKDTLYKADNTTPLAITPHYEDGTTIKKGKTQWVSTDTSTIGFSNWLYKVYSSMCDSSITTKSDSTYIVKDTTGATNISTKHINGSSNVTRNRSY